ncbi:MAG TPA: serine/threonine-protein kinase, partial [Ktedonobacteraceae bacterium]
MSMRPRHLRQHELQEQLGYGSMAEVWKAFDVQLHRHVAIKLLHANLQEDAHFVERFEREAQLIAALHHPNIVRVHDFHIASEETDGTAAYMVMEYIEGQTLDHYMNGTSRLGNIPHPSVLAQFFASICLAVNYAHQNGIIHRDLKPANILLDMHNTTNNPVGEPILTDFGIAKLLGVSSDTFTNAQLGTPLYISPEQASDYPGNELSDIYSLGVILYEIATGKPPFQGDTPIVVMQQHINAAPPAPRLINPNLPLTFEAVILRCLAKQPGARFPNALSLAAAIAEALSLPIPERLARSTLPVQVIDMPTHLTPPPSNTGLSSPNVPIDVMAIPSSAAPPFADRVLSSREMPTLPSSTSSNALADSEATIRQVVTSVSPPPPVSTTPSVSMPPPLRPRGTRQRTGLIIALLALAALFLAGSLGIYLSYLSPAAANPLVGRAFFTSSGQLNDKAQGIADGLQIDL